MRRLLGVVSLIVVILACLSTGGAGAAGARTPNAPAMPGSCGAGSGPGGIRCLGIWRQTADPGAQSSGLTALQIAGIYHVPPAETAGTGPVVAVVTPYHYADVADDLATYRAAYGLPACVFDGSAAPCFREVDQHGGSSFKPEPDRDDWSGETALDLQMVSAACPSCRLLLVSTSSEASLETGIEQAVSQGAQYVSMSFGGPARRASSRFFQRWPNVLFTAASGDDGYQGADWPNEATNVLAIGGVRDLGGKLSVWNDGFGGTNGGCARADRSGATPRMPLQQRADTRAWATCGNGRKAEADLSAIADPRTGVANYVSGRWYEVGGTSSAAPIIAALYADAGNHTDPYAAYVNGGIRDVTRGSICVRGVSGRICRAAPGWDGPTGLGMPTSPAALAVAPPPPPLAALGLVRGRVSHPVTARDELPRMTRDVDGSTVPLSSLTVVMRGLPDGVSARVRGHQLVFRGAPRKPGHGRATLYVWGRTPSGRRTEAATSAVRWTIAGHTFHAGT